MTEFIKMNVTGLTIDPFTNMPIVILKDDSENVALPIWIGLIEASSIATEIEKIELSRPMTHDLVKTLIEELGAGVESVEITDLKDNTFFARVVLDHNGLKKIIDCRPSDAIAISLRTNAPILVAKPVIEKSRSIESFEQSDDQMKSQKWTEILENLEADDFGKYKM
ncbi:MAG: bifunctional nuclease family protein [Deltaproteobacteria bacterium]|nr:bifunctional nuclease family protein [Deltaproteobacteria bacterium]